jgi:hypothetical protein
MVYKGISVHLLLISIAPNQLGSCEAEIQRLNLVEVR